MGLELRELGEEGSVGGEQENERKKRLKKWKEI
jgi:hypothetical protein